jgi:hypothetical protein
VTGGQIADDAVTTAKILDNNVTLAKMAGGTDGNLITYDASGDPAHVVTGSATHVLTSNGAGAAPTFQAPAAGGIAASEMIGYKQRPLFERTSTTQMTLHGNFAYQHMGTTTQIVSGSNVVFTRSDTSGTQQWNYLYLDDSAIVTAGNATITASELISSPTAPTLSVAKGGFYNGNDRCIFCWLQSTGNDLDNMSRLSQYGGGVEAVRISTQWQFYNSAGGSYGTGWHIYTPSAVYLPEPRGTAGLCIGIVLHLGGSHTTMYVGQDAQNWDMFQVDGSPNYSLAGIDSAGKFQIRSSYDHSSYSYLFHTKGWVMSPLL